MRWIRAAAERLGYTRPAGQSASPMISPSFSHDLDAVGNRELYMQIQNGVQREAHRLGMALRIRWTHSAGQLEELGAVLRRSHHSSVRMIGKAIAAATATRWPADRTFQAGSDTGWSKPIR